MLTDDQLDLYARHIILPHIGGVGQQKLLAAHVLCVGAGGIGCPVLQYLSAAGVGRITVVDDDRVSLSNLQRQILFSPADIGRAKVDVVAERLAMLAPDCVVMPVAARITAENVADIIAGVDVVVDGSDTFTTRLIVADHCHAAQIPLVSAAIAQFQGQMATYDSRDADAPCYRCFVGDAHDPDECDTCAEQGVLGALCGLMGSFAAVEAVRVITGFGDSQRGKIHIFDGLKPAMRTINLPKDPACGTCGAGPNSQG